MKRIFILLVASFLVGSLGAEESVLIDFTKLVGDTEHSIDLSANVAGNNITQDQKDKLKKSLDYSETGAWTVEFNSSSRTVTNMQYTYTKPATSAEKGTVLGVRVHFPTEAYNSKAYVKPPFEIPAVSVEGNPYSYTFEDGFGIVNNVGTIKSIAVDVYGLNFPYTLSVILLDSDGVEHTYPMGNLNFDGWSRLTWNNPLYVTEVRNRNVRIYPLYPYNTPFIKFAGFRIDRNADQVGGDFIAYFQDVWVVYDKAVEDPTQRDIQDEEVWNIIADRENSKNKTSQQVLAQQLLQQSINDTLKAPEAYFDDPSRTSGDQTE